MNISTSEHSSGCESGWTMYLDQLSDSTDPYGRGFYERKGTYVNQEDEDDEDLSMVSDASSGPPHFHEYENNRYYRYTSSVYEDKRKSKHKSKTNEAMPKNQQNLQCFDDTASSPIFNFSQDNLPPDNHNSVEVVSHGHLEGESITKKQLSFFKSSTKGKSGGLLGKKRQ